MGIHKQVFTKATRRFAMTIALILSVCMPAHAQSDNSLTPAPAAKPELWQRYPAGAIHSLEVANAVLAEAATERKNVNAQFAENDRACIPKFFANNCRDMAKERRREALAKLRALEVEANLFKRRERVVERDRALEEARVKEATATVGVSRSATEKKPTSASKTPSAASVETRAADDAANMPSISTPDRSKNAVRPESKSPIKSKAAVPQKAVGDRAEKRSIDEAGDAKKRAEKIAAFEEKARRSEARQREILANRLEKENKKKAKLAKEATAK